LPLDLINFLLGKPKGGPIVVDDDDGGEVVADEFADNGVGGGGGGIRTLFKAIISFTFAELFIPFRR